MKDLHVQIPDKELDFLDKLIQMDFYLSRAEIVRQAIKDWIRKESAFLSSLNSDTKKIKGLHRKFIEFKRNLIEDQFPVYTPLEKEG